MATDDGDGDGMDDDAFDSSLKVRCSSGPALPAGSCALALPGGPCGLAAAMHCPAAIVAYAL